MREREREVPICERERNCIRVCVGKRWLIEKVCLSQLFMEDQTLLNNQHTHTHIHTHTYGELRIRIPLVTNESSGHPDSE